MADPRIAANTPSHDEQIQRLREVLQATRDELNEWGHGDFHYGHQAQEKSVVYAVARADGLLEESVGW